MSACPFVRYSDLMFGSLGNKIPFGDVDPYGMTRFFHEAYDFPDMYTQGVVIAYHPQTHSAAVQMHGKQGIWSCIFADEHLSYSFGFSMTHPPREGECVLVLGMGKGTNAGIIIGRLPYHLSYGGEDLYGDPDEYHRQSFTQILDKTKDKKIPCYSEPLENEFDDSTRISTHARPTDVYPGEFAYLNQHNCGLRGGLFSATLIGGGASLRMSALTNGARLSCASYMRHSLLGSMSEFNNGRYVSSERNVAMYQEERLGGDGKEAQVWLDDSEKPVGRGMGLKGELQTMRPRMKELSGYFGHLMARFCLRPDPNDPGIRVQGESEPKEEGVSRETIDPSGQYRLSAAGMIAIERTGRIPVPVRKSHPGDKDHDIAKDPEALKPFEHDENDPALRQLELFDRQAYDFKTQYARVDGLGDEEHSDYFVPQEEDLKPLSDSYDDKFTKSETVRLSKFDKRRAGVYIGEDGSIIMRDAWGSEIVMLGGNVTVSCAGNVLLLPGKTQLTIAGDDIVQKAQNSVDIHASEHDVRLSAARNMEILGGGDEKKHSGGVIIESRGKGPSSWDGKDKGEDAQLSGITLKTKSQAVVVDGQNVIVRSRKDTRILSGDKGKIDGKISLGAEMIRSRSKSAVFSSGTGNIVLDKGSVNVVAKNLNLLAEGSLNLNRGSKAPALQWTDIDANPAAENNPKYEEATKDLANDKDASPNFDTEALDKMIFGFRKSQECGTDRSWTIGDSGGKFRLYEPAWIQVMKIYETLRSGGIDAQSYKEGPEWENGSPFPGKDADENGEYVQLSGMQPKNLTSDGFNVSRKKVMKSSSTEQKKLSDYQIRK